MNQIKVYTKTFAAFIAGVIGNAVVNLINGATPWPQTGAQWVQFAVTSFGAAIAVWAAPANKITQKQLDKDPNVVGGTVVASAPSGGEYQNPWTKP
jgi:uncharacterized membrane protein YeaQ/YmgE (transglycosylase-associated protein family)